MVSSLNLYPIFNFNKFFLHCFLVFIFCFFCIAYVDGEDKKDEEKDPARAKEQKELMDIKIAKSLAKIDEEYKNRKNKREKEIKKESIWKGGAEKEKGYHHQLPSISLECQERAASLDQIRAVVTQWSRETKRSIHSCRLHCRVRQFTFAFLDSMKCYCGTKFIRSGVTFENCNKPCVITMPSTISPQFIIKHRFASQFKELVEIDLDAEIEVENNLPCGSYDYMVVYAVCPKTLWGSSCTEICMCESRLCNVRTGYCMNGDKCMKAFRGSKCNEYDVCYDDPCQNGGSCVSRANSVSYSCQCVYGFHGENCENSLEVESVHNYGEIEVEEEDLDEIWQGFVKIKTEFYPVASFLGCYRLQKDAAHSFSDYHLLQSNGMHIDLCLKHCTRNNFTIAGLVNKRQCRCAHQYERFVQADMSWCDMRCNGQPQSYCGGKGAFILLSVCPVNYWGVMGCNKTCFCKGSRPCDVRHGGCYGDCMKGYTGKTCNQKEFSINDALSYVINFKTVKYLYFLAFMILWIGMVTTLGLSYIMSLDATK